MMGPEIGCQKLVTEETEHLWVFRTHSFLKETLQALVNFLKMLRKRKKRITVPVMNPFKELALPFEGRRMFIRPEDIQDKMGGSDASTLCITKENVAAGTDVSDLSCLNSEIRSSNSRVAVREIDRHSHGDENHDWKVVSCDTLDGCKSDRLGSFLDFRPNVDATNKNKTKLDNSVMVKAEMNTRIRKSNSRKMFDVSRHFDDDIVKSNRAQSSINLKKYGLHMNIDESRHRKGGHVRNSCWSSLIDDKYSIAGIKAVDDTKLNSNCLTESHTADIVEHVSQNICYIKSNAGEGAKKNTEKCIGNIIESFNLSANSDSRHKGDRVKPEEIQENLSPDNRTNQTYHVRREKHYKDDNDQECSYVIRVNCEPRTDNSFIPIKRPQPFTKIRRGDIPRTRPLVEDRFAYETFLDKHKPSYESISDNTENSPLFELPLPLIDNIRSSKISETSMLPTDARQKPYCVSKTISSKSKVSGRLIDHLERKESLYTTSTGELLSSIGDMGTLADTAEYDSALDKAIETCDTIGHDQENVISTRQSKTGLPDRTIEGTLCKDLPVSSMEQNLVHTSSSADSNESNSICTLLDIEGQFNDLALANMNDNKKHKRGISRSKTKSTESVNFRESPFRHGQREETRTVDLKPRTVKENGMKTDKGLLHSSVDGSCKTGVDYDLTGRHKRSKVTEQTRFKNVQTRSLDDDVVGSEPSLSKTQTPVVIQRVLKPGVVHMTECSNKTGLRYAPLYTETHEHSSDSSPEENHVSLTRSEKESSNISFTKSPRPTSFKTRSHALSFAHKHKRSKSPTLSASLNNFQKCVLQSPRMRDDNDRKTNSIPQMLASPSRKSPAKSYIFQNENHSNKINSTCVGDLYTERTRMCTAKHVQSPLPKARSTVVDDTGTATLNELNIILEEARANSVPSCELGDSNTSATHVSCADSKNSKCTGPSFIGEYLRSLWKHQTLCDTRVSVGNAEFLVHKLVLAAYSSVFCPSTPKPEPTVCFSIPNSNAEAVAEIFNYMYTSTMTLTDDLLEPVINAALFMGVHEVVDIVKDILAHPTLDNIASYNSIIRRQGLRISLVDQESLYREAFSDIKHNVAFLGLSLHEIECILTDPDVMVSDEAETIEVIISWVEYNYMQRISVLATLLDHVSFECIAPNTLAEIAQKYSHIFDTPAGNSFLCEAFKFHALNTGPTYRPKEDPQAPVCTSLTEDRGVRVDGMEVPTVGNTRYPDNKKLPDSREGGDQILASECEHRDQCQNERAQELPESEHRDQCQNERAQELPAISPKSARSSMKSRIWDSGEDPDNFDVTARTFSRGSMFRSDGRAPNVHHKRMNRTESLLNAGTNSDPFRSVSRNTAVWGSHPESAFASNLSPNTAWRMNTNPESATTTASPSRSTTPSPETGGTTPTQYSQTRSSSSKGRISRVSFQSSAGDYSPEISVDESYPTSEEMFRNSSRNNNAFDGSMLFLMNGRIHSQSPVKLAKDYPKCAGSSNKDSKLSCNISVKSPKFQMGYDRCSQEVTKQRRQPVHLMPGNTDRVAMTIKSMPKLISVKSKWLKGNSLQTDTKNVLCRSDGDIPQPLNQHLHNEQEDNIYILKDDTNISNNEDANDNYQVPETDDKSVVSRSRIGTRYSVVGNGKIKCVGVQNPLKLNNIRGGDYKKIGKNVSEESLMMLGHDAEASAFRIYKPI